MRRRLILSAVLLIAIAGIVAAAIHFRDVAKPAPAAAAPPAIPVVAGNVQQHDVPIYLRGVGTVIAYNNVIVRSQITGQLVKVAFTQGQTVKKGDLLGEIDPRPYQAQLDDTQKAQLAQLQAIVKSDEALIEQAKTNLSYTQLTSPIDGVTGIRQIDEG